MVLLDKQILSFKSKPLFERVLLAREANRKLQKLSPFAKLTVWPYSLILGITMHSILLEKIQCNLFTTATHGQQKVAVVER